MMGMLRGVFFVALTGSHFGYGLPIGSTPQNYPYDGSGTALELWGSSGGLYAAVPALALLITAIGLLLGCTWCYRHKDCKQPNQGADNQLFAASATHLQDVRRAHPPDSGFSEPVNNNISEDNNNGPISLREMQNIANNNAAAYIVSENEERNRVSRESVVEFEPLPTGIGVADPLERCADWFGGEDFPRNRLQYLREIGRGWFGRVVEGEIEDRGGTSTVAVKILNQNASLEDKARFLDEARVYRDVSHENVLAFIAKCLNEDPWILIFELCSMDLQQYLIVNRHKMAVLNEAGVPLRLMCDVSAALAHLHARGHLYGDVWSGAVLVRGAGAEARAVLGRYSAAPPPHDHAPPERLAHRATHTTSSDVWSLGTLVWQVSTWGMSVPRHPPPLPDLPCPYRNHLYQVMQLCWNLEPAARPTSEQVHALINHLYTSHTSVDRTPEHGYGSADFEERWQRLKPNTIPVVDEHIALVHAPANTLNVDISNVSRSSSIMSDRDITAQIKSESLTNLHGSLEDVRNIYLTHNETALLECHQGNVALEEREREHDRSDSSMDPWLKEIIAGSQDDVSYYKDVSDVIKNLDNILNSEKTSSSESSHQASPSRDNLSLDCKKDYPVQSSMVKSPGINNFQNLLEAGFESKSAESECEEDDIDRDTLGTLSHSFERHSDTLSQQTLENITPETPIKDLDVVCKIEYENEKRDLEESTEDEEEEPLLEKTDLPNDDKIVSSSSEIPELNKLCVASMSSVSEASAELSNETQDCRTPCDNNLTEERTDKEIETKSIDDVVISNADATEVAMESETKPSCERLDINNVEEIDLPKNTNDFTLCLRETEVAGPVIIDTSKLKEIKEKFDTDIESPVDVTKEKSLSEPITIAEDSANENETMEAKNIEQSMVDVELISEASETTENVNFKSKEKAIVTSDLIKPYRVETLPDSQREFTSKANDSDQVGIKDEPDTLSNAVLSTTLLEAPESVQNIINSKETTATIPSEVKPLLTTILVEEITSKPEPISPETVQKIVDEELSVQEISARNEEFLVENLSGLPKSEETDTTDEKTTEKSNDSTAYMDLINDTNSEIVKDSTIDENIKEIIKSCLETSNTESVCTIVKNESTIYMDLPSSIKETDNFLHSERIVSSQNVEFTNIFSSTPMGSDRSNSTLENPDKDHTEILSETKVPDYGPGVSLTKLEQKYVPENMSPLESPTKSHHTDTYDENSSVVLGPFENCSLELFKGVKSSELVDLPREELLAFSSNFSEINLETPSPLRDGRFLHEVPDIIHDDIQFDDIETISEVKSDKSEPSENSNETECLSGTEKRVSPLTPPNSPGTFLASSSQQNYIVDIDLDPPAGPSNEDVMPKEVDLNQIELQITTKLAMAENENNMNIEYSGPLMVQGLMTEEEQMEEAFLAGNGSASPRKVVELDEECVQALRNELELKLPLAQVSSIEPACSSGGSAEWGGSLPPPPELVLSYPGALSPIAEETGPQLTAYETDLLWNTSVRTDSSESYPEPCNNSTDEATELPTAAASHRTYTVRSPPSGERTFTVQRDATGSNEITMSADSLNPSPYKKPLIDSLLDDRTYTKDDEKESNLERISQVSPYILSPTTETSAPDNSDYVDNATGVSTLSKTTVPTDAKASKPSETQCLSKATSIDSWCSNDTLYNVEENFDDLAMDSDLPLDFEPQKEDEHSESSNTLTHNDDDKELSHCSTYIVHDSKSEPCDTFSPDSITANDNYTYTKARTEAAGTTPSNVTKSDLDSTKNTQTKDLAYGTLMSGLPSYSNCTTEVASCFDDVWKLPQPEMVRRSPICDEINVTPSKLAEEKDSELNDSPQLPQQPCLKKLDSVEITCLHDNLVDSQNKSDDTCLHDNLIDSQNKSDSQEIQDIVEISDSPNCQYKNMAPSVTSTPLTEMPAANEDEKVIPMPLPEESSRTPDLIPNNIPNFQTFLQSAEVRPQDISPNNDGTNSQDTEILLEGDSKTFSRSSNRDSLAIADRTPNYSDFENSAITKPQEVNSRDRSSQSVESGMNSEDFRYFENSIKSRPQDLSSVIDASSSLLHSERQFCDLAKSNSTNVNLDQTSQSASGVNNYEPMQSLDVSPPNDTNLLESHDVGNIGTPSNYFIDMDVEEETEQPLSIIITEKDVFKESPNRTYDSHTETVFLGMNHTYDSHEGVKEPFETALIVSPDTNLVHVKVNGVDKNKNVDTDVEISPKAEELIKFIDPKSPKEQIIQELIEIVQPSTAASLKSENGVFEDHKEIKCNGNSEKYATVQFLNETFEELIESNVDEDVKDVKSDDISEQTPSQPDIEVPLERTESPEILQPTEISELSIENKYVNENTEEIKTNGVHTYEEEKLSSVTENFLQNEKKFCQLDSYLPLLSDIRFTGPGSEIMSTSFTQDSPTSPSDERDSQPDVAEILKEWDSDTDSHSTNSSSGEFIWKDGDGRETALVPSTHFDHQRGMGGSSNGGGSSDRGAGGGSGGGSGASSGSGDSGSGSEGDEVEFVPSSWDCRAAPSKSSLRSLEQATPDNKKRVVFKRQKYHCVYEYPREAGDIDAASPAYMPDLSTYAEWEASSAEEAELGYGQLFGAPAPLELFPLRAGVAFDYDEDFFISSSARPFESLGLMSSSSQFFPGMHAKALLEPLDPPLDDFPPPPPPLPAPALAHTKTPSLDFTTPDSGVEDITPGSISADDEYKKSLVVASVGGGCWRGGGGGVDSGSSSESASPMSPRALGGLRHTRDKLKLDLPPPSPRLPPPSPRHARVFNFVLDKPRPLHDPPITNPNDTPVTTTLPLPEESPLPLPEPTFSTFGKTQQKPEPEQKIILTDEDATQTGKVESPKVVEAVKGEGTVLDSGDEDSGIESSSKATLERKTTPTCPN